MVVRLAVHHATDAPRIWRPSLTSQRLRNAYARRMGAPAATNLSLLTAMMTIPANDPPEASRAPTPSMPSHQIGRTSQVKDGNSKRKHHHSRYAVHHADSDVSELSGRRGSKDKHGRLLGRC